MKKLIIAVFAFLPALAMAAGGNVHLDKADYDLSDKASLQNGAKLFMNYCSGWGISWDWQPSHPTQRGHQHEDIYPQTIHHQGQII